MFQKLPTQEQPLCVGVFLSCNKSALWHQLCDHRIHKYGLQCKGHNDSNKSWCASSQHQLALYAVRTLSLRLRTVEDPAAVCWLAPPWWVFHPCCSVLHRLAQRSLDHSLVALACWFDVVLLSWKCHTDAVPHRLARQCHPLRRCRFCMIGH